MTLRCRPGDLAVVVRASNFPQFIGRIVRVTKLNPIFLPSAEWHTEPPLLVDGEVVYATDGCLRPIRPDAEPVDVGEPVEASTC